MNFRPVRRSPCRPYYDRFKEEQAGAGEIANTYDFDGQHRFALGSRNDITWGVGYREVQADFRSSIFAGWNPSTAHDHLFSSFIQDEISLVPDRLKLTLGSKFEHNDYTGFEWEPSARLLWTPTEHQTVWAAVSRAVRTPSWSELHFYGNLFVLPPAPPASPLPVLISSMGNQNLRSEDLIAYELGYRVELAKHFSVDVAGFYNNYDHLIVPTGAHTTVFGAASPPYAQVATADQNTGPGHTYGMEISARWDVTDHWHLTANYSWLYVSLGSASSYLDTTPDHQAQVLSTIDLPHHFELNGALSFVDEVSAQYGLGQMVIPHYVRLDVGVVWHATKNLEIGVWGQILSPTSTLNSRATKPPWSQKFRVV